MVIKQLFTMKKAASAYAEDWEGSDSDLGDHEFEKTNELKKRFFQFKVVKHNQEILSRVEVS